VTPADSMDRGARPAEAQASASTGRPAVTTVTLDAIQHDGGLARILKGSSWVLATVRGADGRRASGMAGVPHEMRRPRPIPLGLPLSAAAAQPLTDARAAESRPDTDVHYDPSHEAAIPWAALLESADAGQAAVGLAVANALLALDPAPADTLDGVTWLIERAADRSVAVVGHFPFADRRLRPVARQVWIIEREPGEGEVGGAEAESILARAEIVVITGSAVANHTIDDLMDSIDPKATVMMLGPSTPLVPRLLEMGFDALSGVRVTDEDAVARGVAAGESFRRLTGLSRVTLVR